MFNGKGYNLSDIAAVTNGGRNGGSSDGMWGDNGWWIILLFLFAGWGRGGMFGGNGYWWILVFFLFSGWGGGFNRGNENVRDAVAYGFDVNNLENGIRGLEHGICDGFRVHIMHTNPMDTGDI